jgi:hypothetical protein
MFDDDDPLVFLDPSGTAEWRRIKAEQFPDDNRNLMAAEELERLASEIEELHGSIIHKQICQVHNQLLELGKDASRAWHDLIHEVSAELRSIGFQSTYATGAKLAGWYGLHPVRLTAS